MNEKIWVCGVVVSPRADRINLHLKPTYVKSSDAWKLSKSYPFFQTDDKQRCIDEYNKDLEYAIERLERKKRETIAYCDKKIVELTNSKIDGDNIR